MKDREATDPTLTPEQGTVPEMCVCNIDNSSKNDCLHIQTQELVSVPMYGFPQLSCLSAAVKC